MEKRVLSIIGFLFWLWIYIPAFAENIQYTYDDLNRLTQVTYEDGTIINYTYDEAGNRLIKGVNSPHSEKIAVIRQKIDGTQRLEIFNPPTTVDGETGPPIASDLTFGDATTNNNNIALAGIDINGDGVDEVAVIRERPDNGRQRLYIFNAPTVVDGVTGPPIASDLTFGDATTNNNNIALAGIDINGDGVDEVAVIRERPDNGRQRLYIFNAPTVPDQEVEPAIASDLTFGNANKNNNNIALAGADINGDGVDEIAVIRQRSDDGRHRLFIFNAPTIPGGEAEPAIATDFSFGNVNESTNNIALAGIDINGDEVDEVAVIRERPDNGRHRLFIFNAPTIVGGEAEPAIATDFSFGNATTDENNIAIAGLR
jgi:YD repeat-containing protein